MTPEQIAAHSKFMEEARAMDEQAQLARRIADSFQDAKNVTIVFVDGKIVKVLYDAPTDTKEDSLREGDYILDSSRLLW